MRAVAIIGLLTLSACGTDPLCGDARCHFTDEEWRLLSAIADVGPPPPSPGNAYLADPRAQKLGQRLFFDGRFSGPPRFVDTLMRPVPTARTSTLSCASCHDLRAGGHDVLSAPSPISVGTGWMGASSPTLINVAYYPLFFWNARIDSLWGLTAGAVENPTSMNGHRMRIADLLATFYAEEYAAVFGAPPFAPVRGLPAELPDRAARCPQDRNRLFFDCLSEEQKRGVTRTLVDFSKAIEAYLYLLVRTDSAFDRFIRGEGEISPSAIRGARLFAGKAACIDCHSGPMLTDHELHNTGVTRTAPGVPGEAECPKGGRWCDCVTPRSASGADPKACPVQGGYEGRARLQRSGFTIDGQWSDLPAELEQTRRWGDEIPDALRGAWRTPSLRDVARTAPYMHNGSLPDLWAVIRFYDEGGTSEGYAPEHRSPRIRPLGLTAGESADLVAFLETLDSAPLPESLLSAR